MWESPERPSDEVVGECRKKSCRMEFTDFEDWCQQFRCSNLEGGLKGFENVVKRTSNGAYRSPRRLAVTKHL